MMMALILAGCGAVDSATSTPESAAAAPRELTIEDPADGSSVTTDHITIRGKAPSDSQVRHERFGPDEGIDPHGDGSWEYDADLDEGENTLNFHLEGQKDETRISFTVTYDPSAAETNVDPATETPATESGNVQATNPTPTNAAPAPTNTAPPTSTPEPTPTATVPPTATPEPTATATPEPTATATPVPPTATADDSAAERAYASLVMEQSGTMQGSLSRFSDLMQDPQIFDDAWILDVAVELVIWDSTYDEALAITPPSRFAEFHAVYVEALGNVSEAGDLFAQGIDNFDADLITQAAEKLNQGTVLLEEAAGMLNELS